MYSVAAYFVAGTDIGKFTMQAVDDVRTLNKSLHFRPSCNFYNMNELAALWEKKIGKTLPRATVTEEDLLAVAAGSTLISLFFFSTTLASSSFLLNLFLAENRIPESIVASFTHDIFIKGCQVNFSVDGPNDVEVSTLYPDEAFRTLDECFEDFVHGLNEKHLSPIDENTPPNPMVESLIVTATCA